MASLLDPTGARVWLCANHLIGRHRDNHLVLADDNASRQHAVIRWQRGRWVLRDLGSRNGSFVEGDRLAPGAERSLAVGHRVHFATPEVFVVHDLAPPQPMAVAVEGGPMCVGVDQVLGFPDSERPEALLVRAGDGWALELAGEQRRVEDGERIRVAGRWWRLCLPDPVDGTLDEGGLRAVAMRFEVSRDEEHVQVALVKGVEEIPLGSRVHHYTLLVLARQREQDADAGLDAEEQGWIAQADLERMLRVDRNVVYQHLYRARRELAEHLVDTGLELIERRHDAGQLRLGVDAVEVCGIGG